MQTRMHRAGRFTKNGRWCNGKREGWVPVMHNGEEVWCGTQILMEKIPTVEPEVEKVIENPAEKKKNEKKAKKEDK